MRGYSYLVLLVDAAHQRGGRRQDLVHEDEDGLLRRKLDALADNVDELAYGKIRRYQVLLLIYCCNIRLFNFLAYDLQRRGSVSNKIL